MNWEQLKETCKPGTLIRVPLKNKIEEHLLLIFQLTDKFDGKLHLNDLTADRHMAYSRLRLCIRVTS